MKVSEVTLAKRATLSLNGREFGAAECAPVADRADALRIQLKNGGELELPAAVDVSEQLRAPRIFLIEGESSDAVFLFGGEKAYRLSIMGEVDAVLQTFRTYKNAEYWNTDIIARPHDVVIVYEAGVLVVDEALAPKFHKSKLFNDFFASLEGDSVRLLRDHETEWRMQLADTSDVESN
jgi:hypothetical protein